MPENASSLLLKEKIQRASLSLSTIQDTLAKHNIALEKKKISDQAQVHENYLFAFHVFEKYFQESQKKYVDIALQIFKHALDYTTSLSNAYLEKVKNSPEINYMEFLDRNKEKYAIPQELINAETTLLQEEKNQQNLLRKHHEEYQSNVDTIAIDASKVAFTLTEKEAQANELKEQLIAIETKYTTLLDRHHQKTNNINKSLEIFKVEMSVLKEIEISQKWIALCKDNKINVHWKDTSFVNSEHCQAIWANYHSKIKSFESNTTSALIKEDELLSLQLEPLHPLLDSIQLQITDIQEAVQIKVEDSIEEGSMCNEPPPLSESSGIPPLELALETNDIENITTDISDEIIVVSKALSRADVHALLSRVDQLSDQEFIDQAVHVTQSFYKQLPFFWDSLLKNEPIKSLPQTTKEKYIKALHASLAFLQEERDNHSREPSQDRKLLRYNQTKRCHCLQFLTKISPDLSMETLKEQYPLHPIVKNSLSQFKAHLENKNTNKASHCWHFCHKKMMDEIKEFIQSHDEPDNTTYLTDLFNLVLNASVSNQILCFNFFKKLSADPDINADKSGYLKAVVAAKHSFLKYEDAHGRKTLLGLRAKGLKEKILDTIADKKPLSIDVINPTNQPSFFKPWRNSEHSMNLRRTSEHAMNLRTNTRLEEGATTLKKMKS